MQQRTVPHVSQGAPQHHAPQQPAPASQQPREEAPAAAPTATSRQQAGSSSRQAQATAMATLLLGQDCTQVYVELSETWWHTTVGEPAAGLLQGMGNSGYHICGHYGYLCCYCYCSVEVPGHVATAGVQK